MGTYLAFVGLRDGVPWRTMFDGELGVRTRDSDCDELKLAYICTYFIN